MLFLLPQGWFQGLGDLILQDSTNPIGESQLMRIVRRLAIALVSLVVLSILSVTTMVYILGRMSVPPAQESASLSTLSAAADITFDAHGIPTIQAETMLDAYQALGYLHARDRLWQMEAMRRIGSGRMAELAGPMAVRFDILMRELGLRQQAEMQARTAPFAIRETMEAYSAGVNAFLEAPPRPLPIEFQLLLHSPEPWTPADSMIWGRLMSLQLSGNAFDEEDRAVLESQIGPNLLAEFQPSNARTPTTMHDGNKDAWITQYDASNAWVLDGTRTQTGAPILANDPHLGLGMPGQWYMARIETPDLTLVGATSPGVPFHILGHNGHIAWGLTTTHADNQDTTIIPPEIADKAARRTEQIEVRFWSDIAHDVLETQFGPYISRLNAALAWTGMEGGLRTPEALYHLNRAKNWDRFLEAMALFDDPAQNVFYADRQGQIGMKVVGRLPIRAEGQDGSMPRAPDPNTQWTGFVEARALPGLIAPKDGLIANANNRVIDGSYPYEIAQDYIAGFRAERMYEVLAQTAQNHSIEDSIALQMDTVSHAAAALVPTLLGAEPGTELGRKAQALLADWDFDMDRTLVAPTLYSAALSRFIEAVAVDDLGPETLAAYGHRDAAFAAGVVQEHIHWCDDIRTPVTEDCLWAASAALDRAAADLAEAYGNDPNQWLWGRAHEAPMRSQPLGFVPLLGRFLNRPIETSGGDHTVNRGQSWGDLDSVHFAHRHGAGLRAVYDLSDLNNSRFSLAGGQSGNPFSAHYGSLVEDWRDGRYFKIPGRADDRSAASRLVLSPN